MAAIFMFTIKSHHERQGRVTQHHSGCHLPPRTQCRKHSSFTVTAKDRTVNLGFFPWICTVGLNGSSSIVQILLYLIHLYTSWAYWMLFHTMAGEALAQVAQRGGGYPILEDTQGQAGWALSTWWSCRCLCSLQGSWTKWPLRVPSNSNDSMNEVFEHTKLLLISSFMFNYLIEVHHCCKDIYLENIWKILNVGVREEKSLLL